MGASYMNVTQKFREVFVAGSVPASWADLKGILDKIRKPNGFCSDRRAVLAWREFESLDAKYQKTDPNLLVENSADMTRTMRVAGFVSTSLLHVAPHMQRLFLLNLRGLFRAIADVEERIKVEAMVEAGMQADVAVKMTRRSIHQFSEHVMLHARHSYSGKCFDDCVPSSEFSDTDPSFQQYFALTRGVRFPPCPLITEVVRCVVISALIRGVSGLPESRVEGWRKTMRLLQTAEWASCRLS